MDIGEIFEGKAVISSDGERVGLVTQTYKDAVTGRVEWLLFDGGLLDQRDLLIPTPEMVNDGDEVRVPYTAEVIREQPEVEAQSALSPEALSILAAYFGLGSEGDEDWNAVKV